MGQQDTRVAGSPSRSQPPRIPATGARILLVDDDSGVREVLARLLERDGFSVIAVGDIDEALDELERATFNAAVLDIHLSDPTGGKRSGIDVLNFVRNHDRLSQLPVLVLTGAVLTVAEEQTILGLHAYVLQKAEGWRPVCEYLKHLAIQRTD